MVADEALRRSRREAADHAAFEASLRRSRVETQMAAERAARESALRRSRIETEL